MFRGKVSDNINKNQITYIVFSAKPHKLNAQLRPFYTSKCKSDWVLPYWASYSACLQAALQPHRLSIIDVCTVLPCSLVLLPPAFHEFMWKGTENPAHSPITKYNFLHTILRATVVLFTEQ